VNFHFITDVLKRLFEYADWFQDDIVCDVFKFLELEDTINEPYFGETLIGVRDPIFTQCNENTIKTLNEIAPPSITHIVHGPKVNMLMFSMEMGDLEFSEFITNLLNIFDLKGEHYHETNHRVG
ncbi:hypothetical protein ACTWQB_17050, partial [Piscibacillus sp. B03]|uniref:hypothetical protein n=1 Tax=Piscibacillus sp. B03 TaxID=3457430 RepID=UPI003FCD05C6